MDNYKYLEDKLDFSNDQIDKLLKEPVFVKIIYLINNQILLKKDTNLLPAFTIIKNDLNTDNILKNINNLLNINIDKIDIVPYEYFNNYQERYYIINMSKEDILNINALYSFFSLNNIKSQDEYKVLDKLVNKN